MSKKTLRSLLLAGVLTAVMLITGLGTVLVSAKTYPQNDPGWYVTYTTFGTMKSNFKSSKAAIALNLMEPGDDARFRIAVKNDNSKTTYWYLQNKVIKSFEDSAKASGGMYSYRLSYRDNKTGAETVYYDSTMVGGEAASPAGVGLHQATYNWENEWLYMDKLAEGEGGTVELYVKLDGETLGNNYMDTAAELTLEFAVELESSTTQIIPGGGWGIASGVKTGDDTPIALYLGLAAAAGVVLLIIAVFAMKRRKKEAMETEDDTEQKGGYR